MGMRTRTITMTLLTTGLTVLAIVLIAHAWMFIPAVYSIFNYTLNIPLNNTNIVVVVSDPYNAGWQVTWSYNGQTYTLSGSTTEWWYIDPPYYPIQITFQAVLTQNPPNETCTITPTQVTNNYTAGSVQVFTITCQSSSSSSSSSTTNQTTTQNTIEVIVNDTYGAYWQITWSDTQGVVSGSQTGSGSTQWVISNVPSGDVVNFNAQVTGSPSGLTCSIEPSSVSAQAGYIVTFTVYCQTQQNAIEVIVNDPYNATWRVQWYSLYSNGVEQESTSYNWTISGLVSGATVTFEASIVQSPNPFMTCTIQPNQTKATTGQVVVFNVDCTAGVEVTVDDPYNVPWVVNWTVYEFQSGQLVPQGGGQQSGSTSETFWAPPPSNNYSLYYLYNLRWYLTAEATGTYNGVPCAVTPTSTWAGANMHVTFTVYCGFLVSVTNDSSGGIEWEVAWNGAASGSKTGWTDATWDIPASGTLGFSATILSCPSSLTCGINPSSTTATAPAIVTFTVTTGTSSSSGGGGSGGNNNTGQPGCNLVTSASSSPSGIPVSVNPNGTTFLSPGQSTWVVFNAPSSYTSSSSSSSSYWYAFQYWTLTANPVNDTNLPSSPFNTTSTSPEVYVSCPSNLNSTINIQVSGTAYYQKDYVTLSGPTSVSQNGTYTYTLSWSVAPYSAYEEDWSLQTIYNSQTSAYIQVSATLYATDAYGNTYTYSVSWTTNINYECSGTLKVGVSPNSVTDYVSGQSNSDQVQATITIQCQTSKGPQ